ncbi:hypothetical protein T4D_4554 [Trichinella pseudospiralis]|uniref:Uncharacterized protein n=1 Tax=Trichinella pseudospiralis TaxID=6337 RepID=A0A0V1DKZ8_TRIPS|nr:hypothetical protein T4D_4554 [Trichinella pseudospiralis]
MLLRRCAESDFNANSGIHRLPSSYAELYIEAYYPFKHRRCLV